MVIDETGRRTPESQYVAQCLTILKVTFIIINILDLKIYVMSKIKRFHHFPQFFNI